MSVPSSIARFDRTFFVRLADWLAVAGAIALPWSTIAVDPILSARALWLKTRPLLAHWQIKEGARDSKTVK